MDGDSWSARLSAASRRYQSALQSRSDMFAAFEEFDEEDIREEFQYPCPFCSGYFDIVGLCCHIDEEHPVEPKDGVCPVCAMRVGVDMVDHITLHHGNAFKMHRKRKTQKSGSHSTLSMLRKELREGNLHSLFGGSSFLVSPASTQADPLLSSFILPTNDELLNIEPQRSSETLPAKKQAESSVSESRLVGFGGLNVKSSPLSVKDQEEHARKSKFVQGLLLSTIISDNL
uniref:Uncharacterized protein n=1 Tax=Kalanchoe fedtschenkoi TaxID=63787 RepID=A0A7N1A0D7_KALFE